MAGPSSKIGYQSIITAETPNPPEIESNINPQATEANVGRNGLGSLKKKECDDIVEQDCGSEIKNPKLPNVDRNDKGLREAARDSEWYDALERQDCKVLMVLLKENPSLVAETGPEGWTVLHATARRVCVELMNQVFDLFNKEFVGEKSEMKVGYFDFTTAKCGKLQVEAVHIAWFTCPHEVWKFFSVARLLNARFMEKFPSLIRESNVDASPHLRDKLVGIMQGEAAKKAFEFLHEYFYDDDADYNFMSLDEGLQFHYACKMLHLDEGEEYVQIVIRGCLDLEPPESMQVLTYKDLDVLLKEEHLCVNAEISCALHLAILYNDVRSVEALLKCPQTHVNALFKGDIVYGYRRTRHNDDEITNF